MPKNRICKFLITENQFELIKGEARSRGYKKISPYLRDVALHHNRMIEDKIIEIHRLVKIILENKE